MSTRADVIENIPATSTAIVTGAADKNTVVQSLEVANRGSLIDPVFDPTTEQPFYIGTFVTDETNSHHNNQPQVLNLTDTLSIVFVQDYLTYPYRKYVQAIEWNPATRVARSGPPALVRCSTNQDSGWAHKTHLVKAGPDRFLCYDQNGGEVLRSYTVDPATLVITFNGEVSIAADVVTTNAGTFCGAYLKPDYALITTHNGTTTRVQEVHAADGAAPTVTQIHSFSGGYGYIVRAHDTNHQFAHVYFTSTGNLAMCRFTYDTALNTMSTTVYGAITATGVDSSNKLQVKELRDDGTYGFVILWRNSGVSYQVYSRVYYDDTTAVAGDTQIATSSGNALICAIQAGPGLVHVKEDAYSSARHQITRNGNGSTDTINGFGWDSIVVGFKDFLVGVNKADGGPKMSHTTKASATHVLNGTFLSIGFQNPARARWVEELNAYVYAGYGLFVLNENYEVIASTYDVANAVFSSFDVVIDDPTTVLTASYLNFEVQGSGACTRYIKRMSLPKSVDEAPSTQWAMSTYHSNYQPYRFGCIVLSYGGDGFAYFEPAFVSPSNYYNIFTTGSGNSTPGNSQPITSSQTYFGNDLIALIRTGPDSAFAALYDNNTYGEISRFHSLDFTAGAGASTKEDHVTGTTGVNTSYSYSALYGYTTNGWSFLWGYPGHVYSADNTKTETYTVNVDGVGVNYAPLFTTGFMQGTKAFAAMWDGSNGYRLWSLTSDGAELVTQDNTLATEDNAWQDQFGVIGVSASYFQNNTDFYKVYAPIPATRKITLTASHAGGTKAFDLIKDHPVAVGEVVALDAKRLVAAGESLRLTCDKPDTCEAYATVMEIG
ncbi:MAG: hypothetical protein JJ902_05490 [Roseibium sp.]|nr:hypothetical protein [Roseibium sp.]